MDVTSFHKVGKACNTLRSMRCAWLMDSMHQNPIPCIPVTTAAIVSSSFVVTTISVRASALDGLLTGDGKASVGADDAALLYTVRISGIRVCCELWKTV